MRPLTERRKAMLLNERHRAVLEILVNGLTKHADVPDQFRRRFPSKLADQDFALVLMELSVGKLIGYSATPNTLAIDELWITEQGRIELVKANLG